MTESSLVFRIPLLVIVVSGVLTGQSLVFSPPGFQSKEGSGSSNSFGKTAAGRFMFMDGEFRNSIMKIRGIGFRPDYKNYNNSENIGRTWRNVTIAMSEVDITRASTVFSSNSVTTPTTVFSGAVTWPKLYGFPSARPAPCSIRFTFSRPWVYTGINDIGADYSFLGGTLSGQRTWPSYNSYFLDAYNTNTDSFSWGWPVRFGKGYPYVGGCIDGAFWQGAYFTARSGSWGPNPPLAYRHLRNNIQIVGSSVYTTPGKPVVHVLSLGGKPAGLVFPGVACNRLYVDVARPTIYSYRIALPKGSVFPGLATTELGLVAYRPAFEGLELWWQAAWDDPISSSLRLTAAEANHIMAPPVPVGTYKRLALVRYFPGWQPFLVWTSNNNPIACYFK